MSKTAPDTTDTARGEASVPDFKYISREEAIELLDEHARTLLGMSGEEFVRRYRAGQIEDPDRTDVIMTAMIIPLTEQ